MEGAPAMTNSKSGKCFTIFNMGGRTNFNSCIRLPASNAIMGRPDQSVRRDKIRKSFLLERAVINGIHQRITDILYLIIILPVKIGFKRKNDIHTVDIFPDLLYPSGIPRPQFRRYIIKYPDTDTFGKTGNPKIETRIIYQNHNIRFPGLNIVTTNRIFAF